MTKGNIFHSKLTKDEVQAIVYHDGQYVADNASVARNEEPLTLLLQYADTWSGFVLEKKIEQTIEVLSG